MRVLVVARQTNPNGRDRLDDPEDSFAEEQRRDRQGVREAEERHQAGDTVTESHLKLWVKALKPRQRSDAILRVWKELEGGEGEGHCPQGIPNISVRPSLSRMKFFERTNNQPNPIKFSEQTKGTNKQTKKRRKRATLQDHRARDYREKREVRRNTHSV